MKINSVMQIANWRLCVGCGACLYICPQKKIKLIDVPNDGIRPVFNSNECGDCCKCLEVCPGYEMMHLPLEVNNLLISDLKQGWGPILEIWEGYACDPDVRFSGSSGGLATALSLYCLEKEKMYGVLHIGADLENPWKNVTCFSKNRQNLLVRTGSRYSPASPCDRLYEIEHSPRRCVFIGKPCDVAALTKAYALSPLLAEKVGISIGIFCAGTPSTEGTMKLLEHFKVDLGKVAEIRYRGKGWPGLTTIRLKKEDVPALRIGYRESWGFLQKYRPYRCYLCPDGTSEFADISCGDPWYRDIGENEVGHSLVLVRTEKGREILHSAMESGYVRMQRVHPKILMESQENLLLKRKAIWGRLVCMKAFSIPIPHLDGFSLFKNWCSLSISEKLRSILGTARRILQRKYFFPMKFHQ